MYGLKVMCMKVEHPVPIESVSFVPCTLPKLSEAYSLTALKSWYPHLFNTEENLDCICPIPDVSYYGVNEMGKEVRREFLAWYDSQISELFDKRRVLESYCHDDVTAKTGELCL